jgi:hypothetical protein
MGSLGCPYHAILGNHDVECFPHNYYDNAPVAEYREAFGRDPWRAEFIGGVLFVFVTVERQPCEPMRTINAVYASDRQFRWVEEQISAHPGAPTVIVSHAPSAGSGLRCAPPLHCGALDTYLDQTYDAARWRRLIREYPQIRAWFSAHFHMGHDYDSAISERRGVVHVSCGVAFKYSRDDQRHTRFADIDGGQMRILTFDHDRADTMLAEDAAIDLSAGTPAVGRVSREPEGEMLVGTGSGEGEGVRFVRRVGALGRYYIATARGVLWEYDPALAEFTGALTLRRGCADLRYDGERLYFEDGVGERFSLDPASRDRFEQIGGITPQEKRAESALRGEPAENVAFTTRESREGLWVRFMRVPEE